MTELTGKDEVRVRRLSAREKGRKYRSKSSLTSLKTFDSCNEPYVRAQLAIATMRESQNKLICGSDKKVITQLAIATYEANSLTSLKTFDSCNEQPYVRTQLAIATRQSMLEDSSNNIQKPDNLSLIHI